MLMQMNESTLIFQYGFKIVAEYKKFEKCWDGSWDVHTAKCLQNGEDCIIKLYHGRSAFTLVYDSKKNANAKIKQLIDMGYKREK